MRRGASLRHLDRQLKVLKVRDRLGKERNGSWTRKMGTERRSRQTLVWEKKEDHTSAPTCQWRTGPRKCHFQPPVSRKPLIQNVSRVVLDNLGILILPLLLTGLWSKATGSLSFSFTSIFTLQKVKKSTNWSSLEPRLHEEANTNWAIDFCLFSKSSTHLELCDSLVLWLTSWLASRVLGFIAHPRLLVLVIVNIFFFSPVCWMQPRAAIAASVSRHWIGGAIRLPPLTAELSPHQGVVTVPGRHNQNITSQVRAKEKTDNETDGNGTRRRYYLPQTDAWFISVQRRTVELFLTMKRSIIHNRWKNCLEWKDAICILWTAFSF